MDNHTRLIIVQWLLCFPLCSVKGGDNTWHHSNNKKKCNMWNKKLINSISNNLSTFYYVHISNNMLVISTFYYEHRFKIQKAPRIKDFFCVIQILLLILCCSNSMQAEQVQSYIYYLLIVVFSTLFDCCIDIGHKVWASVYLLCIVNVEHICWLLYWYWTAQKILL